MLEILTQLCEGTGTRDDLDHLSSLAKVIKQNSFADRTYCPNPVLTGLTHFRDEFERTSRNLSGAQMQSPHYVLHYKRMHRLHKCAQACPPPHPMTPYEVHKMTREMRAMRHCFEICPVHAVEVR